MIGALTAGLGSANAPAQTFDEVFSRSHTLAGIEGEPPRSLQECDDHTRLTTSRDFPSILRSQNVFFVIFTKTTRTKMKPFCRSRIFKRSINHIDMMAFLEFLKSTQTAVFGSVTKRILVTAEVNKNQEGTKTLSF